MCGECGTRCVGVVFEDFRGARIKVSDDFIGAYIHPMAVAKTAVDSNDAVVLKDEGKEGDRVLAIRNEGYSVQEKTCKRVAAKMTRTSTELPRLEPESSASANSAMAAN